MNWASIGFDWNHIRAFLATVEEGSLSGAARALGQSQPTLSRQIAALEADLGVVLFERVGRGLTLAPAGADLVSHVRAMGEAAGKLSLVASGRSEAVEGTVTLTASDTCSAYLLPPILTRLKAIAPGIVVDVVAANDIRDLQRREADIAIRHVRPDQPDLIARKILESTGHLYAAESYIAAHGRPKTPEDLGAHNFIGFQPLDGFLGHLNAAGMPITERNVPFVTQSGVVAWELGRNGLGIAINARHIGDVFPDMELLPIAGLPRIPVPFWLTCHRELHTSKRIRLVYDFLAEAFSAAR